MAVAIRSAFSELYERNEYAHDLPKEKLTGVVTEITGASRDDTTTKCIVSTFWALKEFADFDEKIAAARTEPRAVERIAPPAGAEDSGRVNAESEDVNLAISYTINLNLPETTNPDVFNAIFKALKESLLTRR